MWAQACSSDDAGTGPNEPVASVSSLHAENPEDWFVTYSVSSDGTNLTRRTFDPWMSTRAVWSVRP